MENTSDFKQNVWIIENRKRIENNSLEAKVVYDGPSVTFCEAVNAIQSHGHVI